MKQVFVDAGIWVALLHPREEHHQSAIDAMKLLGRVHFVTTEMVLTEVLNILGKRGSLFRRAAAQYVRNMRDRHDTTIVEQTGIQFEKALRVYEDFEDKAWGHTDCASFRAMKDLKINETLSLDRRDFGQMGITVHPE